MEYRYMIKYSRASPHHIIACVKESVHHHIKSRHVLSCMYHTLSSTLQYLHASLFDILEHTPSCYYISLYIVHTCTLQCTLYYTCLCKHTLAQHFTFTTSHNRIIHSIFHINTKMYIYTCTLCTHTSS